MLFPLPRQLLFLCACIATVPAGVTGAAAGDIPPPETADTFQTPLQSFPRKPLARTLSDYIKFIETDTKTGANFKRLQQFLDDNAERSGWFPKFSRIQQNAEIALARTRPSPEKTLEYLQRHPPITGVGLELLGEALIDIGKRDEGVAHIRNAWRKHSYLKSRQRDFLQLYAHLLTADDHTERLEMLLWNERIRFAKAMFPLVTPQERALANARIYLMEQRIGVDAAIRAVPDELHNHPALAYERVRWRRRKGREDDAIELLLLQPPTRTRPDKWWVERHRLARYALRQGRYLEAYQIARDHALTSGIGFADGEFLAGWIALRFLDDPQSAYLHFKTLQEGVTTPISIARAAYWRGRAAEEIPDANPQIYWRQAAALPTTYYGQIAGTKIVEQPQPKNRFTPQSSTAFRHPAESFLSREAIEDENTDASDPNLGLEYIVTLAHDNGDEKLGNQMLLHQARQTETPGEFETLADIAAQLGQKHIQLRIAKTAARKHLFLQEHLYPTDGFPQEAIRQDGPVDPALLLAIARQESEFNPLAVSPSGALGMMQLLPNTARHTAKNAGVPYDEDALTRDPGYNVFLGTEYIHRMIRRFDGSYILAVAAYNAGPTRVSRWIKGALCDPRKPDCDDIDWIERVPIEETRNYVQRVLENLQNYRRILGYNTQTDIHAEFTRSTQNQ